MTSTLGGENAGTKGEILKLMIRSGDDTVEVLSNKLSLNPSVIRRHLEDLVSGGLVDSHYEKVARGRPRKTYSVSFKGRDSLFGKYDVFLDLMTSTMLQSRGKKVAEQIFAEAASKLVLDSGLAGKDGPDLIRFLTKMGFEPEEVKEGKTEFVISHNCPIVQISRKYPELACDVFHTDFLKVVKDNQKVILKQAISRGAKNCIHEIREA